MNKEIEDKIFPNEETFRQIYEECGESAPIGSDVIKNSYRELSTAFDEYLAAIQEDVFRYAYQCGYEAALAEMKKGGGNRDRA